MVSDLDEYFVEEKTSVDRLLDFLVFIAVFAVTIFLILELLSAAGKFDMAKVDTMYAFVNVGVFIIFFADLVRLWMESTGPKDFFKNNWLDVLATLPWGLFAQGMVTFEILKLARVSRLAKVTKVSRISRISKIGKQFKAASHLKKEGDDYKQKHRL